MWNRSDSPSWSGVPAHSVPVAWQSPSDAMQSNSGEMHEWSQSDVGKYAFSKSISTGEGSSGTIQEFEKRQSKASELMKRERHRGYQKKSAARKVQKEKDLHAMNAGMASRISDLEGTVTSMRGHVDAADAKLEGRDAYILKLEEIMNANSDLLRSHGVELPHRDFALFPTSQVNISGENSAVQDLNMYETPERAFSEGEGYPKGDFLGANSTLQRGADGDPNSYHMQQYAFLEENSGQHSGYDGYNA
jgi:hypothetical protein